MRVLGSVLLLACITPAMAQTEWLEPVPPGWSVPGKISQDDQISGIACVPADERAPRACLIAVDEKFSGVFATLHENKVVQDEKIRLAPERDGEEFDAEAVAYDRATAAFYVMGSYGMSRHKCEPSPGAHRLVRVPVDTGTGRPVFDYKSGLSDKAWVAAEIKVAQNLTETMRRSPKIENHVDQCLGSKPSKKKKGTFVHKQGVNIEGLAIVGDALFVGLRGPVHDDTAYLLQFDRDAVFAETSAQAETIAVKLGKGMGVRDLAAVRDGLLILSGPEDDEPGQAAIHYFDLKTRMIMSSRRVKPSSEEAKPEALLVLKDGPPFRVLVLSDGVPKGEPTEFIVNK